MNNEEKLNEILKDEEFLKVIAGINDAKILKKKFKEKNFNLSNNDAKEVIEKMGQIKTGKITPDEILSQVSGGISFNIGWNIIKAITSVATKGLDLLENIF